MSESQQPAPPQDEPKQAPAPEEAPKPTVESLHDRMVAFEERMMAEFRKLHGRL